MPVAVGFNHVATLTTDMDLTVRFSEEAFGGEVTFEVAKAEDHPWEVCCPAGDCVVVGTGVDPVTSRFSGARSAN